MYERFTDRARQAMVAANEEAKRLNHEYIGTEHMLLGLMQGGNARIILLDLSIDPEHVRAEVYKLVQRGPDMCSMSKLPQTPRSKKVIEYAIDSARELNDNYVGTEHLLLGLLREQEGVGSHVLRELGVTKQKVLEGLNSQGGKALRPKSESTPQKLTTAEILARARAEKAANASELKVRPSVADILAAARGERSKPISDPAPQKPLTTAEILAQCRPKKEGAAADCTQKVQQVACALLRYFAGESSAEAALDDISRIVG